MKKQNKTKCEHNYIAVEVSYTQPSWSQWNQGVVIQGTAQTGYRYYKLFCTKCGEISPGPTP